MKLGKKALRVMAAINTHPNYSNSQIAYLADCTSAYVGYMRKKMQRAEQQADEELCSHGQVDTVDDPCETCWHESADAFVQRVEDEAPTQHELDEALEHASILSPASLDAVLNERGSRYGSFLEQAVISQRLKAVMADTPNWIALNDDMVEALEMIAIKIARILNGDPSYVDSWVDIAGYSQLVADRLQGKVR